MASVPPSVPYATPVQTGAATPAQPANMHIVYGIAIEDPHTARLARKVMQISTAMALCALISSIFQLITGSYYQLGIFAAVILPLCGYCGALRRSRFMLIFFSVANIILGTLFIISFIISMAVVGDYVSCACNDACRSEHGIPASDAAKICSSEGKYRTFYWIAMGFAFAMTALQLLGFYYGIKLVRTKHMLVQSRIPAGQPVMSTYPGPAMRV